MFFFILIKLSKAETTIKATTISNSAKVVLILVGSTSFYVLRRRDPVLTSLEPWISLNTAA